MKYDSTGREVVTSPGANPTGTVGLAAVNGTAATCIRSDGAPALDQGIAPTWTAKHIFSLAGSGGSPTVHLSSAVPFLGLSNTSAAADEKHWRQYMSGGQWTLDTINDAFTVAHGCLAFTRTGVALTAMNFGNTVDNPAYTFSGAHNGTAGGNLASGTYTPTLTAVSNTSALVASVCQWMRVGNVVTVSGYFTVTTSGTPATWGVSLPVASNLTAINQCNGAAVSPGSAAYAAIYITADATNDRAQFQAVTGLTTAAVSFTFTYVVL